MGICLDCIQLAGRFLDRLPERGIAETFGEVTDDQAHQTEVSRTGSDGSAEGVSGGAWFSDAGIDCVGILIGTRVRFDAPSMPFGSADHAIEIVVTDDAVVGAKASDEVGGDDFGASAVFGLGMEDEARVFAEASVFGAVVMIDPSEEAGS